MMNSEPDYEAALGLIKHLSTGELRELVNNEDKLVDLIKDLPQMRNLNTEKEMLLASNKSLAEYNISFEHKLAKGKQDLISRYEESSDVQEKIKIAQLQIDNYSTKQTPEAVQLLIKQAAQEIEEETEKMVETFLNNEPSVEEFVEAFLPKRVLAHQRRIKGEKAKELISKVNRTDSQNSFYQQSLITMPWATPYPTQLPNMPMPTPTYSVP